MNLLGCLFGIVLGVLLFCYGLIAIAWQTICRYLGIKSGLGQHTREQQQAHQHQNRQQIQQNAQESAGQQSRKQSVFNDDEGEYIDFEEIKDSASE